MGTLYLVRHGQASFGATDYDQLSPLGLEQSRQLGRYWQEQNLSMQAVYCGTLRRHQQTLTGIAETLSGLPLPTPEVAWNEYDSHALIRCLQPQLQQSVHTAEGHRAYFRLLCDAMAQWMSGVISPEGMPSWDEFSSAIRAQLDHIRRQHHGDNVLLVTSGGPIATATSLVLGCTPEAAIALNMRLRNTAVTEFSLSPRRCMLQTFNTIGHLDTTAYRPWITFT